MKTFNYNRAEIKAGIVHFGVGNFHRAHLEAYTNLLLENPSQRCWGVFGAMIMPTDGVLFNALKKDDGIYQLTTCSPSGDGMDQMIDYIYEHYDNFRLLLKCGDSGKFETFIHNMVDREMRSSLEYVKKMKEDGIEIPIVGESLMHMIYTGFFSSIFQIIEHDIDKEIAKRNVHKLREFNTGGWERLWNVKF